MILQTKDQCRAPMPCVATQARTADMLTESRRLRGALETSEARSDLVQQFLQQYQLSHDEVYALKVCDDPRRCCRLTNVCRGRL